MKHTFTEIAPCRQKLELVFEPAEVDAAVDSAYRSYNQNIAIKGFRPGTAPRRMIERKYGAQVYKDSAAQMVQDGLGTALEEAKVNPLGDPTIDREKLVVKPGEAFEFALELDVRPDVTLGEYTGLSLVDRTPEPTEADVDKRVEDLARQLTSYEATEDPAAAGDVLEVDARMVSGEAEIVDVKAHRVRVEGEQLFGVPCPGLVEKLAGARPGAEISLEQTIPEDHPREELRGKPAETTLKVLKVSRPHVPTVDEAFAARLQFKTLADLRAHFRRMLDRGRDQDRRTQFETQISEQLIERHPLSLPEAFVQRQASLQLYQNRMRLARMGVTKEFLDEKAADMVDASRKAAERSLRWSIISDAIAEKEELQITQEEVTDYINAVAQSQRTTPDKIMRTIRDHNGMMAVAAEIRDAKVYTFLIGKANVEKGEPLPASDAEGHVHDENCGCENK